MGALGCSECNEQGRNITRMRPTHGRSRLCGCVPTVCFHLLLCLCLFTTNQRLDEFVVFGFERLGLVSSDIVDGFGFFVLRSRHAGHSRGRVEQGNMHGLCLAISQGPSCEPPPHISATYQFIGRVEKPRQWRRTAGFGSLGSSK